MKIKKFVQLSFQTLIVLTLLFANITSVGADGGGDPYIGQKSVSISKSISQSPKLASQPLPTGGSATATAQLAWTASRMDGKARSSLSSSTVGTYSICATAVQLYMNSSPQGGAGQVCAAKTGGGSVTSTKSKIVVSVFGKSWRVDTSHAFTRSGWSGWFPSLSSSVNL
jgi:hypothetical protein